MLLQFNFKNYKSFRDDTSLDLYATKITEHDQHVIKIGPEKILPVSAIFGANASGKSNIYKAFKYMKFYVLNSFTFGDDSEFPEKDSLNRANTPFLFSSDSKNAESTFEVHFIDKATAKTYNYGFSINKDIVTEEWLNIKAKTSRKHKRIFYRSPEEIDLSGLPKKVHDNINIALQKETLIVSLGTKLRINELKTIYNWFIKSKFADFGNPIENFFLSRKLPYEFAYNISTQAEVIQFFSTFDSNIKGFLVEQSELATNSAEQKSKVSYKINAVHNIINSTETTHIPLQEESSGTLKMFALYPALKSVLDSGSILFIDELNANLHPLLVRNFILTFLKPQTNPQHAQLIFTTHDAWQLANDLLRRDEIWFTEKDIDGISTLYSLADFVDDNGSKIRKDESYEKNYLFGKYGAIPDLKPLFPDQED